MKRSRMIVLFLGIGVMLICSIANAADKKISKVQVVNEPTVYINNDTTEPIPVTVENQVETKSGANPNLCNSGPGGKTIAGPGFHDFSAGYSKKVTIFRVFTGAVMACYTLDNVGGTTLLVNDGATGTMGPGMRTMCRSFESDTWISVETSEEGVGKFYWRVDLLEVIDSN